MEKISGPKLEIKKRGVLNCQTPGCKKDNPPGKFHHSEACEEKAWQMAHNGESKPAYITNLLVTNIKTAQS